MAGIETPDWLEAIALVGDDGGTLRLVAVDSNGQLYNVIKGDYAGTPTTVTVDSQGRLSAFVVDSSDVWEQIVKVGNAELAARLGGVPVYHRTGQVIFQETFKHGMSRWTSTVSGGADPPEIDPTVYATDGYSCKMVADDTIPTTAQIETQFIALPIGRMGFSVALRGGTDLSYVYFEVRYYDGTNYHVTRITIDDLNDDLELIDDSGSTVKIDDLVGVGTSGGVFNRLKFVVDFENDLYDTLYYASEEHDISAHQMRVLSSTDLPHVEMIIRVAAQSGKSTTVYIDDVVLTSAEP